MRPLLALLLSSVITCLECCEYIGSADKSSKQLEWRWSKKKASLTYSIKQYLRDYEVERVLPEEYYTPINIRSKQDRTVVYSYKKASESTVLARWIDILYIAEYCPIASGCEVVAVDLKTGKQLWRTRLQGIGLTVHSKYLNLVNIETDGKIIVVTGNESHGRYIEHLDIQSGKTLANKKLAADSMSWLGE